MTAAAAIGTACNQPLTPPAAIRRAYELVGMDVDGLPVGPVHQLALGVSFQAAGPGKPFGPHLNFLRAYLGIM